jgi:hypothetical protein
MSPDIELPQVQATRRLVYCCGLSARLFSAFPFDRKWKHGIHVFFMSMIRDNFISPRCAVWTLPYTFLWWLVSYDYRDIIVNVALHLLGALCERCLILFYGGLFHMIFEILRMWLYTFYWFVIFFQGGLRGQFLATEVLGEAVKTITTDIKNEWLITGDTRGYVKVRVLTTLSRWITLLRSSLLRTKISKSNVCVWVCVCVCARACGVCVCACVRVCALWEANNYTCITCNVCFFQIWDLFAYCNYAFKKLTEEQKSQRRDDQGRRFMFLRAPFLRDVVRIVCF